MGKTSLGQVQDDKEMQGVKLNQFKTEGKGEIPKRNGVKLRKQTTGNSSAHIPDIFPNLPVALISL